MYILCLDTDPRQARRMREAIRRSGCPAHAAAHVEAAISRLRENDDCLMILNTLLPWTEISPLLDILQRKHCPVLFLSRSPENANHLRALYHGICEVALLPCSSQTLLSAVRHLTESSSGTLVHGSLTLDINEKKAVLHGQRLSLTAQEFELLKALMECPNEPVTREQLLRSAWGYQSMGETRTVDVHVQRLRRKLGAGAIETVYKTGYKLSLV